MYIDITFTTIYLQQLVQCFLRINIKCAVMLRLTADVVKQCFSTKT